MTKRGVGETNTWLATLPPAILVGGQYSGASTVGFNGVFGGWQPHRHKTINGNCGPKTAGKKRLGGGPGDQGWLQTGIPEKKTATCTMTVMIKM